MGANLDVDVMRDMLQRADIAFDVDIPLPSGMRHPTLTLSIDRGAVIIGLEFDRETGQLIAINGISDT